MTIWENDPRTVMSGPLGRQTAFNLIVNGPWTETAAKNLIKQLELQVEWLVADKPKKMDANAEITEKRP
jgi:hypothetical protein